MTDDTQRADLSIDPVCPFTWVTSQWLRELKRTMAGAVQAA
ncbi:MAG: hypothetical protein ABWZ26_08620 [Candidatus Nanopelagicales bacterium]